MTLQLKATYMHIKPTTYNPQLRLIRFFWGVDYKFSIRRKTTIRPPSPNNYKTIVSCSLWYNPPPHFPRLRKSIRPCVREAMPGASTLFARWRAQLRALIGQFQFERNPPGKIESPNAISFPNLRDFRTFCRYWW